MTSAFRIALPSLLAVLITASLAQAQFEGPAVGSALSRPASDPALLSAQPRTDLMHADDIISVQVLGAPEFSTSAFSFAQPIDPAASVETTTNAVVPAGLRISSKGTVQIPYLGVLVAAGKDPDSFAAEIAAQLRQRGIINDPQVFVGVRESPSRTASVLGEVAHPLRMQINSSATLADLFAAAGGLTPAASHLVTIHRIGVAEPIHIDLGLNAAASSAMARFLLQPGDTVLVSKVGTGYVLGMVKTPMAIPLSGNGPITAMRAVTIAGGVPFGAAMSKVLLIHTDPVQGRTEKKIDLAKVMKGTQIDPVLEANDILWVPRNPIKATITGGGAGVFATMLYGVAYMANTVH